MENLQDKWKEKTQTIGAFIDNELAIFDKENDAKTASCIISILREEEQSVMSIDINKLSSQEIYKSILQLMHVIAEDPLSKLMLLMRLSGDVKQGLDPERESREIISKKNIKKEEA